MARLTPKLLIATLLFSSALPGSFAYADQPQNGKTVQASTSNYLIKFKDVESGKSKLKSKKKQIGKTFKHTKLVQALDLSKSELEAFQNDPNIEYIEPDSPVQAASEQIPSNVERVHAPAAHSSGYTGQGVKVAVLDTGVDTASTELHVSGGASFVPNDTSFEDQNGHGTHVAGILSALEDGQGIVGVAPGVDLYSVKVLNEKGAGSYSQVIQGIEWAIDNHMDIVSMSLAGRAYSSALDEAMKKATDQGILLVAAAGNDGASNGVSYPAKLPSVLAVGAVDENNNPATFSNAGPEVKLMAPGTNIQSLGLQGTYVTNSGTSMAVPHVAGVAAILKQRHPSWTAAELRQTLIASALDHTVDAERALQGVTSEVEKQDPDSEIPKRNDESSSTTGSDISIAGDTYEPNDTLATAMTVTVQLPYTSYIYSEDDVDYYKFTPKTTGTIRLHSTFEATNGSYYQVDLLKSTGSVINTYVIGDQISFPVTANTTYYLKFYGGTYYVADPGNCGFGCLSQSQSLNSDEVNASIKGGQPEEHKYFDKIYPYTFRLLDDSDSYEPNDTKAMAAPINLQTSYKSYIYYEGDVDYYQFKPTTSGNIRFTSSIDTSSVKFVAEVQKQDGTILSKVDIGSQGTFAVTANTTYYVKIYGDSYLKLVTDDCGITCTDLTMTKQTVDPSESSSDEVNSSVKGTYEQHTYYSFISPYVFLITNAFDGIDTYEPNDSFATATPLTLGTTIQSYISMELDQDYYVFSPTTAGDIDIRLTPPADLDITFNLYNESKTLVASGVTDVGNTKRIYYTVQPYKQYYIYLSEKSKRSSKNPYTLQISSVLLDSYEPNDTFNSATPIVVDKLYTSYISSNSDVDIYKFTSTTSGTTAMTLRVPADKNFDVVIYDDQMKTVATGKEPTGIREQLVFQTQLNKVYYVMITGVNGDFSRSPYSFKLTNPKLEYKYDASNRLIEIAVQKGLYVEKTIFTYDLNGNLIRRRTVLAEVNE